MAAGERQYGVVVPPWLWGPLAEWCRDNHRAGLLSLNLQARAMGPFVARREWDKVVRFIVLIDPPVHAGFTTWLAARDHRVDFVARLTWAASDVAAGPSAPIRRLVGVVQHSWPLREYEAAVVAHINATAPGITFADGYATLDMGDGTVYRMRDPLADRVTPPPGETERGA